MLQQSLGEVAALIHIATEIGISNTSYLKKL